MKSQAPGTEYEQVAPQERAVLMCCTVNTVAYESVNIHSMGWSDVIVCLYAAANLNLSKFILTVTVREHVPVVAARLGTRAHVPIPTVSRLWIALQMSYSSLQDWTTY